MTRLLLVLACGVSAGPLWAAAPPTAPVIPPGFVALLPAAEPALTDPAKLAERVGANTKGAADNLAGKDPGAAARNAQRQALRDIDELLKLAENQPPPPMPMGGGAGDPPPMPPPTGDSPDGGQPPPAGGQGGQPPPPGGQGGQPPPKGSGGPAQGGPPPGGQPNPMGGGPPPGGRDPAPTAVPATPGGPQGPSGPDQQPGQPFGAKPGTEAGDGPTGGSPGPGKPAPPLDEPLAKQVWGHLPDTVRKQMSQYYKEQFMPRYNGLLKDYFTAIAERDRQPRRP